MRLTEEEKFVLDMEKDGKKIVVPKQKYIKIPEVGEIVFILGFHDKKNLNALNLEQIQRVLPNSLYIPTLRESNLVNAYCSQVQKIDLETVEHGKISFLGWERKDKPGHYNRLFFETEMGNFELYDILDRYYYTTTELKDFEVAGKNNLEKVCEEYEIDLSKYKNICDRGFMATIVENGEECGRTYVGIEDTIIVLHPKFGTPLVTLEYSKEIARSTVDLIASGFPQSYIDMGIKFYGLSFFYMDLWRDLIDDPSLPKEYFEFKRVVISWGNRCYSAISSQSNLGSKDDDFRPQRKGFYVIKR